MNPPKTSATTCHGLKRRSFIFATMLLVAGLAAGAARAQDDGLRIVVLEGEDSVNIIEQGTAVPTLVEVRDSNDLPVAGASVAFLLQGGNATLNAGLSQVAVTTNALGQAAVTVNPIASGAVQLSVNATFQGQTATAAIVQTNFATAAEAAAAGAGATSTGGGSGSGSTSAGGAGGGGLGAGAVAGIAGAAVGGGLLVRELTQAEPCTFSVSPTSIMIDGNGGDRFVAVAANPPECSPAEWTASGASSFISVSPTSGSGSGRVTLTVGQNGTEPRRGAVTIAGQTVSVSQEAAAEPCDEVVIPGGDTPETRRVGLGRFSGRFDFSYNTAFQQDQMIVRYEGSTLFNTGCVGTGGWRTQTLSFSGSSSIVEVEVIPNCAGGGGTGWWFQVSCAY